jgi:EAL domain-containing protein (putative c-di-GMP-specific phosphodiesterase class I)
MSEPAALPQGKKPASGEVVPTPCCLVLDEDASVRHFVSLIMQGSGIDSEEFSDSKPFLEAVTRRKPELVFVNVPLDTSDAARTVSALGKANYPGAVQLMSTRGTAVMDNVKAAAEGFTLRMLPGLKKPFDSAAVQKIIHELKLGMPAPVAARIMLDDAVANDWIEFWYQPKIDLRRKWLVGIETFARARHPEHGVLPPKAFMPGARENSLLALAERATNDAIRIGALLDKLGVHVRISINMPMDIAEMLALEPIVKRHHPDPAKWPGLIVDMNEKSVIHDIPRAIALANKFEPLNVKLALDGFGHGHAAVSRAPDLPFFEMKIDPSIVAGCAIDKDKATICRNVVELAHQSGARAVGVGFEKASEVATLVSHKCDFGQGFLLGAPMPEVRLMSLLRQRAHAREAAMAQSEQPAMSA